MISVKFITNIDFYSGREYPRTLKFRPMIGDQVPFFEQEEYFPKYPYLTIQSIKYKFSKFGFNYLECVLWFGENTHSEIVGKILNHQEL